MWTWIEKVFCLDYLRFLAEGVPSGIQDWLNNLEAEKGYIVKFVQLVYLGQDDRESERYVLVLVKCQYSAEHTDS